MTLAPVPVHPRRLAYLGTPEMAVPPLEALIDAGYEVTRVVTRPDVRRGRGSAISPSPVKEAATRLGIPVGHDVDEVLAAGADLGVVVAFGRLIKPHVLAELPMVNLHFSLLPRWRGAAPVERAFLAGDSETGVCVMQVEEGLDTGPVFACRTVPIAPDATMASLRAELVAAGTDLLVSTLAAGLVDAQPQTGLPTYADKLDPAELRLDWSRPAAELARLVRIGGAWTTLRGKRVKVLAAEPVAGAVAAEGMAPGALVDVVVGTGSGGLRLQEVQPEGRAAMAVEAWLRGVRPRPGESLGT
jgi:methionyl-tRNA formyltransferase